MSLPALEVYSRDRDALEVGELYLKGKTSMINSVHYLIRAGELLAEKKSTLGHGDWTPWLRAHEHELGFGDRTARLLMRGAEQAKRKLTADLTEADASEINRVIWGNTAPRALGTGNDERFTPEKYIELARAVLGNIDLDPASCEEAQAVVRADRFFTKADDGLQQQWHGRVWLNPPFSFPAMGHFVDKLLDELSADRVTAAIMLSHAFTDTSWFHKAAELASALCFTRGRIDFGGGGGGTICGQTFFYFGDNTEDFAAKFLPVGLTVPL